MDTALFEYEVRVLLFFLRCTFKMIVPSERVRH